MEFKLAGTDTLENFTFLTRCKTDPYSIYREVLRHALCPEGKLKTLIR